MSLEKTSDLLARVEKIRSVLERHSEQSESSRQLADQVYDALLDQNLFSLLTPKALGGMELAPTAAYQVWEAVSRIDSAAGWNLSQAAGGLAMSALLSTAGLEKIYGNNPQPIFAGVGFPPCPAIRGEGGFHVSGRASFASGCHHADWIFLTILPMQGDKPELDPKTGQPAAKIAFFSRADVEVIDTWHTIGMRGTGSADVAVKNAFVSDDLVVAPSSSPNASAFSGPLYRLSAWPVIHGEATVSLGVASAAIEKLMKLAGTKRPAMSGTTLRDRELVQHHVGRARSLVDAARAYLHHAAAAAYEAAVRGEPVTRDHKIAMQLAACNAAEGSAKAVDLIFEASGTSGIRLEQGIERHFRDAHVLTQHAQKSVMRYISVGRVMLGLSPDTPLLA